MIEDLFFLILTPIFLSIFISVFIIAGLILFIVIFLPIKELAIKFIIGRYLFSSSFVPESHYHDKY